MTAPYTNAAQQRILSLVLHLFGDVVNGYAPGALAKALETTPSNVTRDLANLATAGLAEKVPATGHWRLSSRLPNQAAKVYAQVAARAREAEALSQQFSRHLS
jgi:DNA-binding IclR family transcriptional regulator